MFSLIENNISLFDWIIVVFCLAHEQCFEGLENIIF
jgi:hypothetical protein